MNDKIVFLGGGGFAMELVDYMFQDGLRPYGYCDTKENEALSGKQLVWLGDENQAHQDDYFYIMATGIIDVRLKLIRFLKNRNAKIFNYRSPKSHVSSYVKLGMGEVLCPGAVIAGDADVGPFYLGNVNSFIGHGAILGQNVVLSPGACALGLSMLGDSVFIGANGTALPHAKIYDGAIIGANACTNYLLNGQVAHNKVENVEIN